MMDISHAMRGPIAGGEGLANEVDPNRTDGGEDAFDDEKANGRRENLKRKLDDDYVNAKKRRKQLKPIRIATNLDEMVKVPKQIIGLNNDLDNMTKAVPNENSSKPGNSPNVKLNDVHLRNDDRFPLDGSNSNGSMEKFARETDATEMNVPNLEMGPNFIGNPNFIYPFSFHQPVKSSHFWSDANLKIFNQEAYCELCKKEFCNKYFLKTHKANKHGIYVDFPSSSSSSSTKSKPETIGKENGRTAGDDCERAFCELCNKRFCNKYFVRRHKTKSHGLPDEENQYGLDESVQNQSNSTKRNSGSDLTSDDVDNQRGDVQLSPLNLIVKDGSDDETEAEDGEDCSSENIEKLQTMLLRLNPSDADGKSCKACKFCRETTDGSTDHKCEYLSEANDSSNESKPEAKNDNQEYLYKIESYKQMKPTSSYCEICNKELCNKYFMRTHMQRMHGIEIEHGTQIGGVVCNICNKELCSKYFLRVHKQNTHGIVSPNAVVGPSTSGNPKPRTDPRFVSNFSQVCYICSKRFRSPKWLQAHFLSDHRDESRPIPGEETGVPEDEEEREEEALLKIPKKGHGPRTDPPEALDVISKLFWENNSSSKSYNCSQCPFTTSVLAFLFVHERSHFVLNQDQADPKPGISLQSLLHDQSFWQHKITQQISECLDLSKSKYIFEQNGS